MNKFKNLIAASLLSMAVGAISSNVVYAQEYNDSLVEKTNDNAKSRSLTENSSTITTMKDDDSNKQEDETFRGLQLVGVEDITLLIGETFYFKDKVSVIYNQQEVEAAIKITNNNGVDISNYESVKIRQATNFTYTYTVTYENETITKQRIVTGITPDGISMSMNDSNNNKLDVTYQVNNPYKENSFIYLEDWSMFSPNTKELLGEFSPGEKKNFTYTFDVVPVFNYLENETEPSEEVDLSSDLYKNILYTDSGSLAFSPTIHHHDLNDSKLSISQTYGDIDLSKIVEQVRNIHKENVSTKIITEDKAYKPGDKITIFYKFENHSNNIYKVSVEDWMLYGTSNAELLGELPAQQSTFFRKEIILDETMVTPEGRIHSAPALHFYSGDSQIMVVKKNINYVTSQPVEVYYQDEFGEKIADTVKLEGELQTPYDVSVSDYRIKKIKDYYLDEEQLPDNMQGLFSEEKQTVIYKYKKEKSTLKTGNVRVKFVDINGQSLPGREDIVLTGAVGEKYAAVAPYINLEIEGYRLIEDLPKNKIGVFTEKEQVVIYVYKKIQTVPSEEHGNLIEENYENVNHNIHVVKQNNDSNPKDRSLPTTGESASDSFYFIGVVLVISTIVVYIKIRYKKLE
ncbi:MucBP domain-containing protein [Enterococcus faecalis]|uniref:MucBP domain-containing protein n=1 Tax=Enterococcus faecalis TaxID=1351 RepID=UPI001369887C|nr:MucBP domain-containing protein [Enterococcus faecalis]NAA54056.1 LPXTG cell wall anchor domain-containing protein [Enterococcus faecalis]